MGLNGILEHIKKELDAKDKRREHVFSKSRRIRRMSTKAIREIHKENFDRAEALLDEAGREVEGLNKTDASFGFLEEALQEYCEAVLTKALIKKEEIPDPKKLGVPSEAYILGLADSIGELRRYILDAIRDGDSGDVEYFLDLMDEIYHDIAAFDYPNAIVPIRRKQDIARSVLERTRGDVTLALKQLKLEKILEGKR